MEGREARIQLVGVGSRVRDVAAATIAGQLAGAAMLMTMMLFSIAEGGGLLDPLRAIGSIGFGEPDLRQGHTTVLLGLVMHQLGFTLFWSLIFAALVGRADRRDLFAVTALGMEDRWGAAVLGLLVGMASNLIDVVIVMPAIAQEAPWTHFFLGIRSWVYHFVFGLGLASFPYVRRRMFGHS